MKIDPTPCRFELARVRHPTGAVVNVIRMVSEAREMTGVCTDDELRRLRGLIGELLNQPRQAAIVAFPDRSGGRRPPARPMLIPGQPRRIRPWRTRPPDAPGA